MGEGAPGHKQSREVGGQDLDKSLPEREDQERQVPARCSFSEQPKRTFEGVDTALHVAPLERQLANLALDLRLGEISFRQHPRRLKRRRGLVVAAT